MQGCQYRGGNVFGGQEGRGLYTVSFEQIESVLFRFSSGKLYAAAKLRDGGSVELVVNEDHRAYGTPNTDLSNQACGSEENALGKGPSRP